ncbi:MAG: sulfatase [Kiritimatiellales bacterium]|nr:sulfatase [Kiritimatiellales bacterium]
MRTRIRASAWFLSLVAGMCLLHRDAEGTGLSPRPNIIFILADDLGWNGVGCQGNKDVSTPNIDRLAAQGMRFTHAYAEPQCSPTRAALLSGQWGARTGVHKVLNENEPAFAPLVPAPGSELPPQTGDLAMRLRNAGYATGISGKWHVANNPFAARLKNRPGYFDAYGFDYVGDCRTKKGVEPDKSVNAITDDMLDFIEQNRNHPFFAYVAHFSPHAPLEAPKALVDQYVAKGFKKSSTPKGWFKEIPTADYYAMIEHLDESVGRVLAKLDGLGLADNTVVIFTSDNGGMNRVADMSPKRMAKGAPYDGGVSVPLVVRWPGHVPAGTTCAIPTHTVDWYPTFAAIAGGTIPTGHKLDGESILPLLTRSGTLKPRALYWHVPTYTVNYGRTPCSFMIKDGWKLIHYFGDFLDATGQTPPDKNIPFGKLVVGSRTELYNLDADPCETHDLAAAQPERVKELQTALEAWWKDTGAQFPTKNPAYDESKWWQTEPEDQSKTAKNAEE